MRASDCMIWGGGLLLLIGFLLLALASSGGQGVFFVFPFLVIGDLTPLSVALVAFSLIIPVALFFLFVRGTQLVRSVFGHPSQGDQETCPACGATIVPGAEYCHRCGYSLHTHHKGP